MAGHCSDHFAYCCMFARDISHFQLLVMRGENGNTATTKEAQTRDTCTILHGSSATKPGCSG